MTHLRIIDLAISLIAVIVIVWMVVILVERIQS
jgi:hypothetical protein